MKKNRTYTIYGVFVAISRLKISVTRLETSVAACLALSQQEPRRSATPLVKDGCVDQESNSKRELTIMRSKLVSWHSQDFQV